MKRKPQVWEEEKPDINEVASEVFQKLSFASGKLRLIWPYRDSISDFYLKGIEEAISELNNTVGIGGGTA